MVVKSLWGTRRCASPAGSCSSVVPTADLAFLKDKVYLKNLFHRIRALPAVNCSLFFFTDGATYRLQAAREEANAQPLTSLCWNKSSEVSRMVKEANHLGIALGTPCLDVVEEAEAQCALLNLASLCDGCSTSDSDAFFLCKDSLQRHFYRSGEGGYVICYEMEEIEKELGFGKNSLLEISLAVLLGGDYANGVHGFGPSAAIFVSACMETGGLSAPQEDMFLTLGSLDEKRMSEFACSLSSCKSDDGSPLGIGKPLAVGGGR
ncbi:hypothetical protein ACP4OV_029455 [Aristida adscensionis]